VLKRLASASYFTQCSASPINPYRKIEICKKKTTINVENMNYPSAKSIRSYAYIFGLSPYHR
jgi:hypothetical protein